MTFNKSRFLLALAGFGILLSATTARAELPPVGYSPEEPLALSTCPETGRPLYRGQPDMRQCCYFNNGQPVWVLCRQGGCFDAGTKITMSDGSVKAIESIKDGDRVFNPITAKAATVSGFTAGPEKIGLIEINFEPASAQSSAANLLGMITPPAEARSTSVKLTVTHPVLTPTGVKQAQALTAADSVWESDGKFHAISSISRLPVKAGQNVFNFVVNAGSDSEKDHMILSNGIATGDLFLQKKLAPAQE